MSFIKNLILCCTVILAISVAMNAQNAASPSANTVVPRLVNYAGSAINVPGMAGVTFSIYNAQQGGAPLWMETQNVQADAKGSYTVQLGATTSEGLPLDLFASGEARWLGVRVNGGDEQPRVLLLSVPYALKAADAQTLGGLPASAFALAAPSGSSAPAAPASLPSSGSASNVGGSGTQDYIPLWTDNNGDLGNSILYQSGSGSSAKIGINEKSPLFTLDVNGQELVRGLFEMATTNYASKTKGYNSQPLNFESSAFNSGTGAYSLNHFQWQAEPTGNDTTTPGASLNLLYGTDPNQPTETGLNIASTGQITFAKGQTFPGTGTITGITTTSGSGMSGGGTSGNLSLSLVNSCAKNQVLQWSGSAWACSSAGTGTIAGVTAGTDLTGGGTSGSVTLNVDTTQIPQLHAPNTFTGNQTVNGSLSVTGVNGNAIVGSTANQGYVGVWGIASATYGGSVGTYGTTQDPFGAGVVGVNEGGGTGVIGMSSVAGSSGNAGVAGYGSNAQVESNDNGGLGVFALGGNAGSLGEPNGGDGIDAFGGTSANYYGGAGIGAFGGNGGGSGGYFTGAGQGDGIYATTTANGVAGVFDGNVDVSGSVSKAGGNFKIDHPLDPANKYLYHSFVESPDMKNIYDGVATLDGNGEAVIQMPEWFDVLNRDFRYQLTCIGGFAPVYIAEKLTNNRFKIGGGRAGMEISWQITGIRQDAWANAHRIPVEQEKEAKLKGYYIHPELYGAPPEKQIQWARHPEMMKRMQEARQRMNENLPPLSHSAPPALRAK